MPLTTDTKINPNVSIGLHPENVIAIEGLDEDTEHLVAHVLTTFDEAYRAVEAVYTARDAVKQNPAVTPEGRVMQLAQFADKKQAAVMPMIDRSMRTLQANIQQSEAELAKPLQVESHSALASEIRAHVAKLNTSQRMSFLSQRMKAGDAKTLGAVLSQPAFLSGMSDEEQSIQTRLYNEQRDPKATKRLSVMRQALTMLEQRGGLVMLEMSKAVGAAPAKVRALREATRKAEAAFR